MKKTKRRVRLPANPSRPVERSAMEVTCVLASRRQGALQGVLMTRLAAIIPAWARWAAYDSHGVFTVYEYKPERAYPQGDTGAWLSKGRSRDIFGFCNQYYRGWTKTRVQIR